MKLFELLAEKFTKMVNECNRNFETIQHIIYTYEMKN